MGKKIKKISYKIQLIVFIIVTVQCISLISLIRLTTAHEKPLLICVPHFSYQAGFIYYDWKIKKFLCNLARDNEVFAVPAVLFALFHI